MTLSEFLTDVHADSVHLLSLGGYDIRMRTFTVDSVKFKIGVGLGGDAKIETSASLKKSEKYPW